MQTVLIVGATGATGKLVVEQLLERGRSVRAIVRSLGRMTESVSQHSGYSEVQAHAHDLSQEQWEELAIGCDAFVSCLGHNLTFKGMFGKPRRLVTDVVRNVCEALKGNVSPVGAGQGAAGQAAFKVILMNTTGNRNRDLKETVSLAERGVIRMLRTFLPPHADNEDAADFLRTQIGQSHPRIEWIAVRPDALKNEPSVTDYVLHPSPVRSAIFNSGASSRINVAHFMAELLTNEATWSQWKGQMPVLYNQP